MMSPDLAWRLQRNRQHREIIAEFKTAEHDRALIAEALQFSLTMEYGPLSLEIVRKLDAVALKTREPEGGGS